MRCLSLILTALMSTPAPNLATKPEPAPYQGAFWYEIGRPNQSLQYKIYDVRQGKFDEKAVERWRETIRQRHPDYGVYVREIRTDGEPGATEAERLAAALVREKARWAEVNRRSASSPRFRAMSPTMPTGPTSSLSRRPASSRSPGSSGSSLTMPPSPFPYPYRPRPL